MGNYKFRLSDMMPNSWFYMLKDMGKPRKKTTSQSKKKKQPTFATTTTCSQPSKPKQLVSHQHHHQCLHSRKSYYFTRELGIPGDRFSNSSPTNPKASNTTQFHDPPRKSSKQKLVQKRINTRSSVPNPAVTSSVSAGCSCRATIESVWAKSDCPLEYCSFSSSGFDSSPEPPELHDEPEFRCDRVLATETFDGMVSLSSSNCVDSNEKDIFIDVDKASLSRKWDIPDGLDSFSELELAPIITKLPKFSDMVSDVKKKKEANKDPSRQRRSSAKFQDRNADGSSKEQQRTSSVSSVRRISSSAASPGVRLRLNSPRIASRRLNQGHGRRSVSSSSSKKSLSDSFAIVKSSFDPQRDFRESMVEMIMENNIKTSKDLEDLLACYLSLNSDEYHELIIKVFKQIWFDLTDIQSK